jgi:uncharacterized membrane protein
MMIFGALFIVVALVALAYALGWLRPENLSARKDTKESALDILKARYARGEISKAEYEEMRDELAT